jgi:Cysteine-rich CWC
MSEPSSTVDPRRCPLCGSGNACGMAEGAESCWCFEATIPAEVIDRVPAEARAVACVCQGCARGERSELTPIKAR